MIANTLTRSASISLRPATLIALALLCTSPVARAQSSIATAGDIETAGKLISTATSGPPLAVSSSQVVSGLNADLVDGLDASSLASASDVSTLQSTVATLQDQIADLQALVTRLQPRLDLFNSRFRATVTFVDGGVPKPASAVPLVGAEDGGFFYFKRDFYADVFVQIVDARASSGYWWVFAAPLTDLEFTLRVVDVETGAVQSYHSAAGARTSLTDNHAFPGSGGYALRAARRTPAAVTVSSPTTRVASPAIASCSATATTLCLIDNRFEISVDWATPMPATGSGLVSSELQTSHTGSFGFFTTSTIDLVAKIVQLPGGFVVSIGALSNVEYTVLVTDTCTSTTKNFTSPQGVTTNFVDDTTFAGLAPCAP